MSDSKKPKSKTADTPAAETPATETADTAGSQPQVQTVAEAGADGKPAEKPKDITKLKVQKSCSRGFGA